MTAVAVSRDDPRAVRVLARMEEQIERSVYKARLALAALDKGRDAPPAGPARKLAGVPAWVGAVLRQDVAAEDVIHELSLALEDEILGHREVVEASAKLTSLLDRVEAIDPALAADLGVAIDLDHYCAIVRATLTAVLARQAVSS